MLSYTENYGSDLDGNRGELRTFYTIEDSDYDTIADQVHEYISTFDKEEHGDTLEIVLIDPITEECVYFTVNIDDYL